MTETFLENYFTVVAEKVKDISHSSDNSAFYRIKSQYDLDEFDNAVRNMTVSCCLLLELGSGKLGESDSPIDAVRIGLHILNKSTEGFGYIKAARAAAKATLLKIVTLMRKDCQDQFIYSDSAAGPLKVAGITFDSKGEYSDIEVDGNWYGKSLYFNFTAPISLVYKAEDYN